MLLMVVPLLSMRLIAEERRNQTLPFLMSAPVSITEIVLGKFLGLLAFLLLAVGPDRASCRCRCISAGGSTSACWPTNALGLLLLSGSFAAVGLYLSCLTAHPLVAAVGTFAVLLGAVADQHRHQRPGQRAAPALADQALRQLRQGHRWR